MTFAMFLSAEDLATLTGYIRPSAQRRRLERHGFRFWVRADGQPAVPSGQLAGRRPEPRRWEPDLSALDAKR
jgi:hypothetical protein